MSVIQSAISSIRNKASEILNDNQGWFRGGKFTPVQQTQQIGQNISNTQLPSGRTIGQLPSDYMQSFNQPNAPLPNRILNSTVGTFLNSRSFGLVQPKLNENMSVPEKIGSGIGFGVGLLAPGGVASLGMRTINTLGGKAISKFAPQLTKNITGRVVGGIGKELAQTGAYTGAQALSQAVGLKEQQPITLGTFGQNLAIGGALRGLGNIGGLKVKGLQGKGKMTFQPKSQMPREETLIADQIHEKFNKTRDISFEDNNFLDNVLKQRTNATQLDLDKMSSPQKINELLTFANRSEGFKGASMGITDQTIKTGGDIIQQKETFPQMEQVPQGKLKLKVDNKPIQVEQGSQLSGVVVPKTLKVSQQSISPKGKLNTKNLNITHDQKLQIDEIQNNVPVTVIGNKDVVKQSKLTTGAKKALTDDQMKVKLAQQLNSRQEVVSLTKQFEKAKQSGADEVELTALKSRIIDQSRIAQQERTFAGRLLQSGNIMANDLATPEQKIYALLDNAGVDSKKYIKDAINVDFNNATQVVNFYRKYVPPKFGEILDEFRYTNMLSSPLTQIVNTFSGLLQAGIVKPIEKTLTGGLDFVSSKLTGKERKYFASQGIDYAKGFYSALPEAFNKFKNIVSGKEMSIRPDLENIPTATTGALKLYTTPLRTLEATDQFFRTLVQSGERKSLARFNLSEKELSRRASESADYTLFRQKFDPTGELGQGTILKFWDKWNSAVQNIRRVPGGSWILPFIQTPTNILKQGFEYSPLGFGTAIGAKRPLEQLSKAIIGTTVFASLYGIADKGGTTWDTPINAKEKELFYSSGIQPYSVKIGDKWVSYSKLGPLAYPMAMASALKWVEKNNPDQNVVENLQGALGEMLSFFGDQSYVSSIGDFINTMKGGYGFKKAVEGEVSNLISQTIPYKSFQGWLTRMIDPTFRKPEGIVQGIQAQTPGLSTGVSAYTDIYGQESKRDMPILNSFSPLKVSTENPEVAKLLEQQQNLNIEKAQVKKEGEKLGLSDAKDSVKKGGEAKIVGNSIIYYDDGVKTLDLSKLDDISKLPSDNKYNSAIKESKQYSEAAKIMDNTTLTTEQQQTALDRLGIDKDKADYYRVANDTDNLKTMFVLDAVNKVKTEGGGLSDIIQLLANQRTEVNGKQIASSGVLDNLVDEGIITKVQATELKKYKFEGGQLVSKSKTGTKAKKGKKISVTLRKMSTPKVSGSRLKVKRIRVPKSYTKVKAKVAKSGKI